LPWQFLHRGKTTDFVHRLNTQATEIFWDDLKTIVDFVFIAMHGRFAEDGILQGVLELLQIPYLGSKVLASALSMDKIIQKKMLSVAGIAVPRHSIITAREISQLSPATLLQKLQEHQLSLPLIVKPRHEGSSLGVSCIERLEDLFDAVLRSAYVHSGVVQDVLIEEKIEGMEFSCIVITDYKTGALIPLMPTEILANESIGFFDYQQKYMPGNVTQFTPGRCAAEAIAHIQKTAVFVMQVLEMQTIARIDGFLTSDNRVIIIDPNSLSGMGPASFLFKQAAEHGMSHTALINHLIETELESYGMLQAIIAKEEAEVNQPRLKVAVLMGGASAEKEISLESGRNVVYKLSRQKYEVVPLFVDDQLQLYKMTEKLLVSGSTAEIQQQVVPQDKIRWHELPRIADFVFIGLHGGAGENGCVQGMLEMIGVPYNGSGVLASALCMNKHKTNNFLRSQGFCVPSNILIKKKAWQQDQRAIIDTIMNQFSFPVIAKPADDGCSFLVSKIKSKQELIEAVDTIFKLKSAVLIEEYITGIELTVGVLGNEHPQALPASQAVAAADVLSIEEKFLPGAGENQTPAALPAGVMRLVKETIEEVYKTVECRGYARIDCFYQTTEQSPTKSERIVILEINTLPGLTPATCFFHQAAEIGLKPADVMEQIITFGLQQHQETRKENLSDSLAIASSNSSLKHKKKELQ
jgi:D-alanine-D-alanine ligase